MVSPSLTFLRTQSDDRLIVLARAGHERAFDAIVERYRRPLLRHCGRMLPEARAEEAVQQAFVAAWAALRRGDDVRHLSGWLHRIVHNAALNALRGERGDDAELRDRPAGGGAPEDQLERRELLRETLTNMAALPERQREALLRVAVDGASAEQVGTSLGLTEGAVRQLLYRARSTLRAAATALTPGAGWWARATPMTAQVADTTLGGGSAGVGAAFAKLGVAAVLAGLAAGGPVLHDDASPSRPPRDARAAARVAAAALPVGPAPRGARVTGEPRSVTAGNGGSRSEHGRGHRGGHGSGGSGSEGSGGSGSSGHGSGGSGSEGTDSGGSGSSGSGSSGSGTSGSGTSGSGSSGSGTSGSGTSGPGTSGSGSSGSGSSGSGTSGSGASSRGSGGPGFEGTNSGGSGSSGSGSTESGTSGSGTSGSGTSGSGSGAPDGVSGSEPSVSASDSGGGGR